jgi:hypothetical protein
VVFFPFFAAAQGKSIDLEKLRSEALAYKMLFNYADSLEIIGKVGQVSEDVIRIAKDLNKAHPVDYFTKSSELLELRRYNDAAFLYHIGDLRYQYYNSANPNYSESNDGALLASFHSTLGQFIGYYLMSNIDNYLGILKDCTEYYITNDYLFYPKRKDPAKYQQQVDTLNKIILDLENNRATYQIVFETMRMEFNKSLDSVLGQDEKK